MIALELISDIIVPLKTSDSVALAQSLMNEFKVSHIPVVNNQAYLGLLSESDIDTGVYPDTPVGNVKLSLNKPMIENSRNIYDVIRMISEQQLTLLPVVDEKENYLGAISLQSLSNGLTTFAAIYHPGAVIILEISQNDYSLSEISQIVESNDTKVLSLNISSRVDSTTLEVILKLNKQDIGGLLQTFSRYGYVVKASSEEEEDPGDLRERYDSLMNYLNI